MRPTLRALLAAALLLPLLPAAQAQGSPPEPVSGAAAAAVGEAVYLFGGTGASGASDGIARVTPDGRAASVAARLPAPMTGVAAAWTGDVVLLVGGAQDGRPTDRVLAYSPQEDRVTELAARLPEPVSRAAVAWTGKTLLVFGGTESGRVIEVDPAAPSARALDARLPSPRVGMVAAWAPSACPGGCAFAFGGTDCALGCSQPSAGAFRYSPANGSLDAVADLPAAGCCEVAARVEGRIALLSTDLYSYDPATDKYDIIPHPLAAPRPGVRGAAVGDRLLLFGGMECGATRCEPSARVLSLDPATGESTSFGRLPAPLADAAAAPKQGDLFLLGGRGPQGPVDTVLRLDPATRETTLLPARLPEPREKASAAWTASGLLLAGGATPAGLSDSILRWDGRGAFAQAGRLPHPVAGAASATDGARVWLAGGSGPSGARDEVLLLAAGGGSATVVGHLPEPRRDAAGAWDGSRLLILGGSVCPAGGACRATDDALAFDPATGDVQRLAPLPFAVSSAAVAARGGSVWLAGGCGEPCTASTATPAAQALPAGGSPQALADKLPSARSGAAAVALQGKLVVAGGRAAEGALDEVAVLDATRVEAPQKAARPAPAPAPFLALAAAALLARRAQRR